MMDVWTVDQIALLPPLPKPKLIGLMLVRNEDWVIGLSARAALQWCDALYVYCHKCTDRTQNILDELSREYENRIMRSWSSSDQWDEMDMRQATLKMGRKWGATHFACVDADEVLTGNLLPNIRRMVMGLKPGEALDLPMIPCWRSLTQYRNDESIWSRAYISTAFADDKGVAWKPEKSGYQHHHRLPYGVRAKREMRHGDGGVMHLQFANWERLVAKHVWYRMVEVTRFTKRTLENIETTYSQATNEDGLRTTPTPAAWWDPNQKWMSCVDFNSPPWQAAECKRLYAEHGPEKFRGLNLFGVAP
jgi:hypothetical protein